GAEVAEAGMHLAGDRAAMRAGGAVRRHELGVRLQFIETFRDRQRVPYLDAVMGEAGHEKRRGQQKELGPGRGIVAVGLLFVEFETGHFAQQPTAQGPGAVVLAGDRERSHEFPPSLPVLSGQVGALSPAPASHVANRWARSRAKLSRTAA